MTSQQIETAGSARRPGKLRTIIAIGAVAAGLGVAAEHGGSHADSGQDYPGQSDVYHPHNAEELQQFAAEHPHKVEELNLKPGMTAGSVAGDLAKKGYYDKLEGEIQEQQDGAVLPDHGQVLVETQFLEDPKASGLVPYDSGS